MKRTICMPVGPAGVRPGAVHTITALVRLGLVEQVLMAESHVVPARNTVWAQAISDGAERILWLDADVSAPLHELTDWLQACDEMFGAHPELAWVGPVVARRGGGWAAAIDDDGRTLIGLGMAYWHVGRVLAGLDRAGYPKESPFRWVPPYSEDYGLCRALALVGCTAHLSTELTTVHDGVGEYREGDLDDEDDMLGEVEREREVEWCNCHVIDGSPHDEEAYPVGDKRHAHICPRREVRE